MSNNSKNELDDNIIFKLGKLENISEQHTRDIDSLKSESAKIPQIEKDVKTIQETLNKITSSFDNFDTKIDSRFDKVLNKIDEFDIKVDAKFDFFDSKLDDNIESVTNNISSVKDSLSDKMSETKTEIENAKAGWKVIVTIVSIIVGAVGFYATINGLK